MRLENSFIQVPRVGEKTEKKLWENGITHWDHVEDSSNISDGKKDRITGFLGKARKNLEVGNSVFFGDKLPSDSYWRMYRNFREDACFFDIETTGLDFDRNRVTTVSFYRNGESRTLVRGEDLTAENLRQEFFESSIVVTFNGKRFDVPFLEKNFDLDIENPHIDLMYPCKRMGLTGGLKPIEKELGIQRELEDIDGREAVRLWKQYEKNGDREALRKLIRYNQYDAENLQDLLEEVHQRLRGEVFEPHVP
ncbi:MAG: ribonuclease H-like domain-containing protein [Candidatus Nanohaloarchaea archaeon]